MVESKIAIATFEATHPYRWVKKRLGERGVQSCTLDESDRMTKTMGRISLLVSETELYKAIRILGELQSEKTILAMQKQDEVSMMYQMRKLKKLGSWRKFQQWGLSIGIFLILWGIIVAAFSR